MGELWVRLGTYRSCAALIAGVMSAAAIALEGAGGQEGGVVAQRNGVTCRTEHMATRDGVLLATDIYLPAVPGKYPVILQRTPYGLRLGHGCFERTSGGMAYWAEHGYVGVNQDVRGTFRSQGTFRPIVQEQADGYDAVEWAATQPWSNGNVGLSGTSVPRRHAVAGGADHASASEGVRARADRDRLPRSLDVRERRLRPLVRAELDPELLLARRVSARADRQGDEA